MRSAPLISKMLFVLGPQSLCWPHLYLSDILMILNSHVLVYCFIVIPSHRLHCSVLNWTKSASYYLWRSYCGGDCRLLVKTHFKKKLISQDWKHISLMFKKHLKGFSAMTLLFVKHRQKFITFLQVHLCAESAFPFFKMAALCCFKTWHIIPRWKVYLNLLWLLPVQILT